MATTRIISTTKVQAAADGNQLSFQRVELTPWDLRLLLLGPIQKGLLFHKPSCAIFVHHLKTSLSRALDFFPPLAGRLVSTRHDDGTTSLYIQCNNEGAMFVHAVADGLTMADIIEYPVYVPRVVHSFFPLNGVDNYEGTSQPLLAVQVTELEDGIFVGCTINHGVSDGTSFWQFFNSWAEISRGLDQITKPPIFDRSFLHDRIKFPIRLNSSLLPTHKKPDQERVLSSALKEKVFHFSEKHMARLKGQANAEIGTTNKISSLQALLCHLWRSIVRNRNLEPDEDTGYCMPVGTRSRLEPPLTEQYFGNAVQGRGLTLKAKELLEHRLGNICLEMNKIISSFNNEMLMSFLESWVEKPQMVASFKYWKKNAFLSSSSPRFYMYGCDFGWGKPVAVRSGMANKFDGKITMFSGVDKGSISIEVCILGDTLKAMLADPDFMDFVTP